MTSPSLTFAQAVRDRLDLEVDATSKYTDQTIGSNIRSASWLLERATGRLFGDRTQGMRFSSNGNPSVTIPGLRVASSVTWAGSGLTLDESFWLIPDSQQTGIYTGIQLFPFNTRRDGPAYLHHSDWFDTNKDSPKYAGRLSAIPNDLVFGDTSTWGYLDADMPPPVSAAATDLAAFLTKYPDALLAGSFATANDGTIDYSGWPITVQQFIADWNIKAGVAST